MVAFNFFPDTVVSFDVETTGLNPQKDEIIEIGAIRYHKGKEVNRFESLIKPKNPIPFFIAELTGITNDMVKDAPPLRKAIKNFIGWLGKDTIIGWNVGFDINFLTNSVLKTMKWPSSLENNYIDVMQWAKKLYPEMSHYKLDNMREKFDIKNTTSHRACADAEDAYKCYLKIGEDLQSLSPYFEKISSSFKCITERKEYYMEKLK